MKRKSLSIAKNIMRRALADLVDPPPNDAEQLMLREHFAHACCYCGAPAPLRSGHFDHADPKHGNRLGNFLLACGVCNGDEKRETEWAQFLRLKCGHDAVLYAGRLERIRTWLASHAADPHVITPEVRAAQAAAEKAIEGYAAAYNELRRAVAETRR